MKTYILTEDIDYPLVIIEDSNLPTVIIVKARNKKHAIELVRKEELADSMKFHLRELKDNEVYFAQGGV
ncbi:MAG: hypothetical protein M1388_01025 [Thaumarchaeota archaeon]|nr:hypothetical protein [Nitrososphaerota archaeon]